MKKRINKLYNKADKRRKKARELERQFKEAEDYKNERLHFSILCFYLGRMTAIEDVAKILGIKLKLKSKE